VARLILFFLATFIALGILRNVLGDVPIIGPLLHIPLISFWFVAILISVLASKAAAWSLDRRRERALLRSLGVASTSHAKGKLAAMLLSQGRTRRALPLFEEAVEGEPDRVEWQLGLGRARRALGNAAGAKEAFEAALAIDKAAGYGAAALGAAACAQELGNGERALECVAVCEREHGPSPESAYRRGRALAVLGRREEAQAAFAEVRRLVSSASGRRKTQDLVWAVKARLSA
jgi:tetratricopeptide (TPR) repeat protein